MVLKAAHSNKETQQGTVCVFLFRCVYGVHMCVVVSMCYVSGSGYTYRVCGHGRFLHVCATYVACDQMVAYGCIHICDMCLWWGCVCMCYVLH